MSNPNEKIVLIDMGDDVVWCDSVPSDDIPPDDVTEYYRADYVETLQEQLKEAKRELCGLKTTKLFNKMENIQADAIVSENAVLKKQVSKLEAKLLSSEIREHNRNVSDR